jgi:predicted acylesterase/phospholipase RssA
LERNNIPIDFIAGSSAGALFGAIYASSKNIEFLQKICFSSGWQKFINFLESGNVL